LDGNGVWRGKMVRRDAPYLLALGRTAERRRAEKG
jgi:hypothetical protein